jgi:hypothetical protein
MKAGAYLHCAQKRGICVGESGGGRILAMRASSYISAPKIAINISTVFFILLSGQRFATHSLDH